MESSRWGFTDKSFFYQHIKMGLLKLLPRPLCLRPLSYQQLLKRGYLHGIAFGTLQSLSFPAQEAFL